MSKPDGMHPVYWSLIFRVGNRDKAMKELHRAEALLGRSLQVASFEPYWKIDGEWRCEATAQIEAASAAELVTNSLLLANRLAYNWSMHAPSFDEAGKLESFVGTFQVGPAQKTKLSSLVWANFSVSEKPFEPWGGKPPPDRA
jgi:hypothetical protein